MNDYEKLARYLSRLRNKLYPKTEHKYVLVKTRDTPGSNMHKVWLNVLTWRCATCRKVLDSTHWRLPLMDCKTCSKTQIWILGDWNWEDVLAEECPVGKSPVGEVDRDYRWWRVELTRLDYLVTDALAVFNLPVDTTWQARYSRFDIPLGPNLTNLVHKYARFGEVEAQSLERAFGVGQAELLYKMGAFYGLPKKELSEYEFVSSENTPVLRNLDFGLVADAELCMDNKGRRFVIV